MHSVFRTFRACNKPESFKEKIQRKNLWRTLVFSIAHGSKIKERKREKQKMSPYKSKTNYFQ